MDLDGSWASLGQNLQCICHHSLECQNNKNHFQPINDQTGLGQSRLTIMRRVDQRVELLRGFYRLELDSWKCFLEQPQQVSLTRLLKTRQKYRKRFTPAGLQVLDQLPGLVPFGLTVLSVRSIDSLYEED